MEMIKNIIKQLYPLLVILSGVLFVTGVFFSAPILSGEGIFEGGGSIFSSMLCTGDVKNDALSYIENTESDVVPLIIYNSGAQNVFDCVSFRALFLVQKEDGSLVSGSTEDGFAIYLVDIKNAEGNSVLQKLSTEEVVNLEEIPADFVYDKEKDLLYFYGSGIYTVYIKVYGNGGGLEAYEFELPVEAS